MSNLRKAIRLYLYYFRVGCYTFGGGWSIVAQMQKDFVENEQLLTAEELLDMISVARSLPGTMIGNVAYLFGYHQAGVIGGVLSVLGIISPPLLILSVLTFCYTQVRDNVYIARALIGVRAAVAPIILSAVLKLHKNAFPQKFCYLIFAIACVLSLVFSVNCIYLILMGILAGALFAGSTPSGSDADAPAGSLNRSHNCALSEEKAAENKAKSISGINKKTEEGGGQS